jgi:hypothetical protein
VAEGDVIRQADEETSKINADTGSSWTFTPGEGLTGEQSDPRDEGK